MNIAVLGAGAWGTALARMLAAAGHAVTLWGRDSGRVKEIASGRTNERHLPGIKLPSALQLQADLSAAIAPATCVVLAVPSKGFREIAKQLAGFSGVVVSVTKGIEYETGLTMCGLLQVLAPNARAARNAKLVAAAPREALTVLGRRAVDAECADRSHDG